MVNLVRDNPTHYKLKITCLESLVTVEEWWDFGGHRIFFSYTNDLMFAIFDGVIDGGDIALIYVSLRDELQNDFDGSVIDLINKYEVK